jgi:hypothetical protein
LRSARCGKKGPSALFGLFDTLFFDAGFLHAFFLETFFLNADGLVIYLFDAGIRLSS